MSGKLCMVTGANSGIGKETSRALARMGASVVMVCRNKSKGEDALQEISRDRANIGSLELMIADFASLDSVRKLAQEYKEKHDRLHVLVNNAGLILGHRVVTVDGMEETFEVNYLSHFLLTLLLLDTLKASAPSRIVNVTSAAHYTGHIDFDDLQEERKYGAMRSYCQSKLAQVLFTHELANRLKDSGVTVNAVHPGSVRTSWGDEGGLLSIGIRIARPFLISAQKGAETPVYVASSPELADATGRYYSNKKEELSSKESYDQSVGRRLWDVSLKLAGLAQSPV